MNVSLWYRRPCADILDQYRLQLAGRDGLIPLEDDVFERERQTLFDVEAEHGARLVWAPGISRNDANIVEAAVPIEVRQAPRHPGNQRAVERLSAVVAQDREKDAIPEAAVPVEVDGISRTGIHRERDDCALASMQEHRLAQLRAVEALRPQNRFHLFDPGIKAVAVEN